MDSHSPEKIRESLQCDMDKFKSDEYNSGSILEDTWQRIMKPESEWLSNFCTQDRILFWV